MEGLPKLPMLYFELKLSPSGPEFELPFKKFIRDHYQEDPESYNREIKELEELRSNACRAPRDVNGCALLKRYYAQMYSLANRFKMFKGVCDVQFLWLDIYTGNTVYGDMDFELACILYNIGALHAELGALDLRNSAESMKVVCTHFQCAAWAFKHIRDNPHENSSKDMFHDLLSFLLQVMLAQAQECILEKSILDNRKSSLVAKVAAQVCEYYNSALVVLLQAALGNGDNSIVEMVGSKLYKEWKRFIEFKISYYSAICSLYMGNFAEEQQKMGERVAWFQSSKDKLSDALKQAKNMDKFELTNALNFLSDVINGKLANAEKENGFVYHEMVPTSDKLTAVKGAALVKGIPFSVSDLEVCGPDIFRRLVPIEAHEIASVYSESKDKIIRDMRAKIMDKNLDLDSYVNSLQLDQKAIRPTSATVPDELIEICAAMSIDENANSASGVSSTRELEEICRETSKSLKEARRLILEEETEEKKHQERFGKRTPSMIIVELNKELTKHEETHEKALQSNANVKESFEQSLPEIQVLITSSGIDLNKLLPPLPDVPVNESNLQEMEKLLAKVEEMKAQRAMLESQLREAIQKDDVIKQVLTHTQDEMEEVFKNEVKKFDKFVTLLDQNMAAQEKILSALTKANANYAETRKGVIESDRLRKVKIQSLINSYEVYQEVMTKTEKGLVFYRKFQNIVARLQARIRSVCRVQCEERAQFAQAHVKKSGRYPLDANLGSRLPAGGTRASLSPALSNNEATAQRLKDFLPYMNRMPAAPSPSPSPSPAPVKANNDSHNSRNSTAPTHSVNYHNQPITQPGISYNSHKTSNLNYYADSATPQYQPVSGGYTAPYSYGGHSSAPAPAPSTSVSYSTTPSTAQQPYYSYPETRPIESQPQMAQTYPDPSQFQASSQSYPNTSQATGPHVQAYSYQDSFASTYQSPQPQTHPQQPTYQIHQPQSLTQPPGQQPQQQQQQPPQQPSGGYYTQYTPYPEQPHPSNTASYSTPTASQQQYSYPEQQQYAYPQTQSLQQPYAETQLVQQPYPVVLQYQASTQSYPNSPQVIEPQQVQSYCYQDSQSYALTYQTPQAQYQPQQPFQQPSEGYYDSYPTQTQAIEAPVPLSYSAAAILEQPNYCYPEMQPILQPKPYSGPSKATPDNDSKPVPPQNLEPKKESPSVQEAKGSEHENKLVIKSHSVHPPEMEKECKEPIEEMKAAVKQFPNLETESVRLPEKVESSLPVVSEHTNGHNRGNSYSNQPMESENQINSTRSSSVGSLTLDIESLMDPLKFSLGSSNSTANTKRRVTKESFSNADNKIPSVISEPVDPLSRLVPLWSFKK